MQGGGVEPPFSFATSMSMPTHTSKSQPESKVERSGGVGGTALNMAPIW